MEYKAICILTTELYGLVISRQRIQTEASINIIVYRINVSSNEHQNIVNLKSE